MKSIATKPIILFLGLIVVSLLLANVCDAKIDPKTCVGAWLFDEGKGDTAKDSSGNGNNGKLMNNPKWDQGKIGSALNFVNANDYVEITDTPKLNPEKTLTLVAWVKPNSFPGYSPIIDKEWFEVKPQFSLGYPSDKLMGLWFDTQARVEDSIRATTVLVAGTWYFVSAVFDNGKVKIFVNGNAEGSKTSGTVTALRVNDTANLCIGSEKTSRNLDGTIDEVAIFNVALADEDIKSIMSDGLAKSVNMLAVEPTGKLAGTWGEIKGSR